MRSISLVPIIPDTLSSITSGFILGRHPDTITLLLLTKEDILKAIFFSVCPLTPQVFNITVFASSIDSTR
ncbi:MAG: hypothetical protein BWX56_01620 [Euryarchaeota archaeon ADurb.Bin023]|nr:MAG: hypothetical protein BWX56_01620 [Euryarchaeota archaeon ADurb.Bin023]